MMMDAGRRRRLHGNVPALAAPKRGIGGSMDITLSSTADFALITTGRPE
jgi:hypothetical protein